MTIENTDAGNPAGETVADVPSAIERSDPTPAPSIDETLRANYRAALAKGGLDEGGGDEPAEVTEGRARGPDGKFLPKPKANGANGAQPLVEGAAPTDEPAATEVAATEPVAAKPHDAAPNTWRKEIANDYAKLPENVREEIHRRENDFHKGITQYKEAATFGQSMAQELIPYQQTMLQHGKHPREVVKEATLVWNTLVTGQPQEKANLWLQIAKDYGIDLSSLGDPSQQSGVEATQVDPRLAAALQRIEKLEGHLTSQERQRAEADFSATVDEVKQFSAAVGSDGKLKYPHFNAVREDMAKLYEAGFSTDLDDLYTRAIWTNGDVRKTLLAAQEKERTDRIAAEAAAARKAAGANVTRRGTPPVPQKLGSIEDTLRSKLRSLQPG